MTFDWKESNGIGYNELVASAWLNGFRTFTIKTKSTNNKHYIIFIREDGND